MIFSRIIKNGRVCGDCLWYDLCDALIKVEPSSRYCVSTTRRWFLDSHISRIEAKARKKPHLDPESPEYIR